MDQMTFIHSPKYLSCSYNSIEGYFSILASSNVSFYLNYSAPQFTAEDTPLLSSGK